MFTLSSAFFPVNRCCEMSSYLMITRVFYSSLFFRASFYLISFFDKIFHFSIIDGNKTEIDLVLMQAFLFSSVNYVVRIFNGKKWRQRKAPLWLLIGRVTFLHLIRTNYFFLMWKHRSLLELARAHLRFNSEFTRTLSNFDFQWTDFLYQKN